MAALLLCVSFNARADGPYTYGPYRYYGGSGKVYSSEESAVSDLVRHYEAPGGTPIPNFPFCNYFLKPGNPPGWEPADGLVENSARKNFVLYAYERGAGGACNGNVRQIQGTAIRRTRAVCNSAQGFRYSTRREACVGGHPELRPDMKGGNVGPDCNCNGAPDVGQPITPATGNMWHTIVDYRAPANTSALTLERIYNSSPVYRDPAFIRGFGVRWTHSYNKYLKAELKTIDGFVGHCWRYDSGELECISGFPSLEIVPSTVSVMYPDGKHGLFTQDGTGNYTNSADVNDRLVAVMGPDGVGVHEWTLSSASQDRTEKFDKSGALLSITERNGFRQVLTYSDGASNDTTISRFPIGAPACASPHPGALLPAGRLLCVTNHWGRQFQFHYDDKGRVIELIDPAGQSYRYEYDGVSGGCVPGNENTLACKADNLTKVTYPDGKSHSYFYNESTKINGGAACSGQPMIGNGVGPAFSVNLMTGLVDENDERYITWTYDCAGRATSSQLGESANKVELVYP